MEQEKRRGKEKREPERARESEPRMCVCTCCVVFKVLHSVCCITYHYIQILGRCRESNQVIIINTNSK